MVNGNKTGIYKSYFESGQIQVDGHVKNGILHGYCIHYNDEGEKLKEGEYNEGKSIGVWKEYDGIGVTQKVYSDK